MRWPHETQPFAARCAGRDRPRDPECACKTAFPLSPHPFADAGPALGLTEDALIARIQNLRDEGAITRFGPFFDAEAMGGAFCLCAMAVPVARFDQVVTLVNAHPEVAHNYERTHHAEHVVRAGLRAAGRHRAGGTGNRSVRRG